VLLNLHEWGDPAAPAFVCLHGITAHSRRFRRLAEERLAERFHVLAPDLRGHAFSDWEPPWTIATHLHDVLETLDDAGVGRAVWLGHSFGGRLVLEAAAAVPERVERAILLDPAIQLLPQVGLNQAELERTPIVYGSPAEAVEARIAYDGPPREVVEEDVREHLAERPDGGYGYRYCASTVVSAFGELCTPPPAPETLRVPTLLLHAPEFNLVRDDQVAAYAAVLGDRLREVRVPGGHIVYWGEFHRTVAAIAAFLEDARP
jgi:lipase